MERVTDEIEKLIKAKRKLHKNTYKKIQREKKDTDIYVIILEVCKKSQVIDEKLSRLIGKYDLLNMEDRIEFIRFKYISEKIDTFGKNNSKNGYEFLKILLGLEGNSRKIQCLDKELGQEVIDFLNLDLMFKNYSVTFEELVEDPTASNLITKEGVFRDSGVISKIDNYINTMNIDAKAKRDLAIDIKESIMRKEFLCKNLSEEAETKIIEYLSRIKPDIQLNNIWQMIILLKIRKLEKYKKFNETFKLMKSGKVSLKELNYKNEKEFIDHMYKEINHNIKLLYNMELYILEKSLGHETKKMILTTVTDLERRYSNINVEEEMKILSNIIRIQDIKLYEKVLELYVNEYKNINPHILVNLINILNYSVEKPLQDLKNWEASGLITKEQILEEIKVYPAVYDLRDYGKDYKIRKDFSKDLYDKYNMLMRCEEDGGYTWLYDERRYINMEESLDDIFTIVISEWARV